MASFRRFWIRYWKTDRSLSGLLIALIIFEFVLPSVAADSVRPTILSDGFFSLLFVCGIAAAASERPLVFCLVATATAGALIIRWLDHFGNVDMSSWNAAADIIGLSSFALVVLGKVLHRGTVTKYRIQGAVAVYLLLGFIWANAYEWTALVHPHAFNGASEAHSSSWIYFSFVTLTTVGYGDITPVHSTARSLANAEALTGQLYLAILISRLVALEIAARRDDGDRPAGK
ncbi:Ion transport 2 domain protein [Chthoniobacter flavus Ellin428]|uniref:Ion transport 2 domain protein n=1 Tax=Chthoniobacter flavus Ellin428 TaxID=497964 RepID=B4CX54_9BACT|nr:potassium channel family protein [Chthoniobacter flavus]EDY20852.1 Ion transport 2 domain protein [Chthoniobacter flavus Ellin428]